MKFIIKHDIQGRIRVQAVQKQMSYEQADKLEYYLNTLSFVTSVKVRNNSKSAIICYAGEKSQVIDALKRFQYSKVQVPEIVLENSGRALNEKYQEKLVMTVVKRFGSQMLLPYPVRAGVAVVKSLKYIWQGVKTLAKGKIEVPVLDATAIGVSILRGDMNTAGSIMFLLNIGEILEEWTHKKSVDDLARSMSLQVEKAWVKTEGKEILLPIEHIKEEDMVVVHMGNIIPFDGIVAEGEAMVNQASLTGESVPVKKTKGGYVYAGTVVEEGEITLKVKKASGASRFDKIVTMIEESEKLKSASESRAEHLADRLVPYTLLGTGLTYLFTRNITKTLSVLMVDFSCALKLAMPITVLSAIREASTYHITVKGGKFLEAMAEAKTIVFDKTGTLTKATPTVVDILSFNGESKEELLRIAACLEEHFPHSMAKAVVEAAKEQNLEHDEMHSKVQYIVAHGISSSIQGKKVIIGSYHFVFEDEGCVVPDGFQECFAAIPEHYSCLYMAIQGKLAAVICIVDPVREEAVQVVKDLRKAGIEKIVMMTGDSGRTAKTIADAVGVDEYFAEVLPEDKAGFVKREKQMGKKVIMIGDGVNDSPALSEADIGIAISDGAMIAQEISDATIDADNLYELVTLKNISNELMKRIHKNYRQIVGFNSALLILGVLGIIAPTTSALLHNTSTLVISLKSMQNLCRNCEGTEQLR